MKNRDMHPEKLAITMHQSPRPVLAWEIKERKTPFVKVFSKVPSGIVCCPFMEIIFSTGCPYDCQYCYLRGTFRTGFVPKPMLYSNWRRMVHEVSEAISHVAAPTVFHTGELADSLAIPQTARMIISLIEIFAQQRKHKLLLLTKSVNADAIIEADHRGQTVVGFSVNPPEVAATFETGTPHPLERLDAAQKCIDAGYPVIFRLDPMIPVKGWQKCYEDFINNLNGWSIRGVAIGTLRAYPILRRFLPHNLSVMLRERDMSGRWRISRETRMEMYSLAMSQLRYPLMGVCKESGIVWGCLAAKYKKKFLCNCRLP